MPLPARADPDRRPGTVTAAAAVTVAAAGLAALCFGFMLTALLLSRDRVDEAVADDPDLQDLGFDVVAAVEVFQWVVIGMLLWCVAAMVLALFAYQRSPRRGWSSPCRRGWPRWSAACLGVLVIFPFLWTAASVATGVLLFTGRAAEWFGERPPPAPGAIVEL